MTKDAPEQKARGRLVSVSADSITILLTESGAEREFARQQIARIGGRRSNVAPIVGTVVWGALAVPFVLGEDHGRVVAFVAIWAGVGWLIGKAIQRGNWKTIYEAP